jgi:hypothetical protein
MVFFSAVMAPLIFIKLGGEAAGRFIRQVFPWYYLVVIALAAVGAAALAVPRPVDAAVLGAVAAVGVAARQVLMPMINRARDAMLAGDAASKTRFTRLHRLSVWINAAQIVAVAVVLARFV